MTATADTALTTQVYRIYIRATPDAIWDAITRPEWTARYGYTGLVDYDLRPGGAYRVQPTEPFKAAGAAMGREIPDLIIEGEVLEADPPRKLVTTFRMLMDPPSAAEPPTRVTHEITHDLDGAPHLALIVGGGFEAQGAGGGHAWVLSDLKTLLESGRSFGE